jgi:lambda repressor-like predicted transcriptional regulator
MHGGRPIRDTGDRRADKLRAQIRQLGITMTELAAELGVHKSDISHALSPRAKNKRYLKLQRRIREHIQAKLKEWRQLRPHQRYQHYRRLLEQRMPKRASQLPDHIDAILETAARYNFPPPPITLATAARILHFKSYTTLLRSLEQNEKLSPKTKREAVRCLELYAKWLREDWEHTL